MDFENRREFQDQADLSAATRASSKTHPEAAGAVPAPPIVPVVLSGGAGSRLWPFSTEDTPKQFLSFTGSKSLFQMTLERVRDRQRFAAPIIVASERHAQFCEAELSDEGEDARLILEPCGRNTAPAIAMAAAVAREMHGDEVVLLVMPSDHIIEEMTSFHNAVAAGEKAARAGYLVTFGIQPSDPDTGFGYIRVGQPLTEGASEAVRFVEKPDLEAAERMVADGQHLWNAGIFLFRAATFMEDLLLHAPKIGLAAQQAIGKGRRDGRQVIPDLDVLSGCPSESVDYAVMEHSSRVAVVPMSPGWSDLGSWDALAALMSGDASVGPITALDCNDCFIRSDGLQVAVLGVRDLIIVASGQRLLILPRGRSQEVKKLLSAMEKAA